MKILLPLMALAIALVGSAAAQGYAPVSWSYWAEFSYDNLYYDYTPAYASAWTAAWSEADNDNEYISDPWTFTYTSTAIDPNSVAANVQADPLAAIGATAQSISAFGDKDSEWAGTSVMFPALQLNPAFDNVAAAQTSGFVTSSGLYKAWSVLPMETYTFTDSDYSESCSWAVGTAIADSEWYW
ncbi:MAG: hypothetical protein HPY61_01705 [Methanotrichaceae archaeon]|nr:hypothetical protein [Methanotrichaceae archaeon]